MDRKEKDAWFNKWYPGRKIEHYDYRVQAATVVLRSWKETLPKVEGKDRKNWSYWTNSQGRVRDEIRDKLLVKPTKNCRLIGTTPFPIGSQPQKLGKTSDLWENHLKWLKGSSRKGFDFYEPAYHDRVTVMGSWGSQYPDFIRMGENINYSVTYNDYENIVAERFHKIKLPYLPKRNIHNLLTVDTNPSSYVGLVSSRLFGNKHRKADPYIMPIAKRLFSRTGNNVCVDNSCWSIGGRPRKQKLHEDKVLRSRMILMPEGPPKIVSLCYAMPIYNALSYINYGNNDNEIRIGQNDFHGNFYKFSEFWQQYEVELEYDASGHDLYVLEEAMVTAFGVLRSCYPPSKKIDNHFFYMMSGVIFKNIAIPGRFIMKMTRGVPSGTPWTSLLVSVVNWLNVGVVIKSIAPTTHTDVAVHVFGDDTKLGWNKGKFETTEAEFSRVFKEKVSMTLDPVVIHRNKNPFYRDTMPQFLKQYDFFGLPARHPKDTMLSASHVKRKNNNYYSYAKICTGLMYASPFDYDGLDYLSSLRGHQLDLHNDQVSMFLRNLNIYEHIRARDRLTYKVMCRNYLYPLSKQYESPRNVDLGNKPKFMAYSGRFDPLLVEYYANSEIYARNLGYIRSIKTPTKDDDTYYDFLYQLDPKAYYDKRRNPEEIGRTIDYFVRRCNDVLRYIDNM